MHTKSKISKDSGLTINQSKVIKGENYIVVNYKANSIVKSVWVLWEAQDRFFSPKAQELERSQHQSGRRCREHRNHS